LTLKQGYRTVYQSTSLVYTDCPTGLKKMAKQQYRWARGSQYNTLRMLPWMTTNAPILGFFFCVDILIPFLWICSAVGWVSRSFTGYHSDLYGGILNGHRPFQLPVMLILIVMASWVSMSLRQQRHLEQRPDDIVMMPVYVVFSTLFLLPIRLYGFARLAKPAGWGTRANAYAGGEVGNSVPIGRSGERHDSRSALPQSSTATATALARRTTPAHARARTRSFNPYELIPVLLFVIAIAGGILYDSWPG
jgi:hyaluronan synthase